MAIYIHFYNFTNYFNYPLAFMYINTKKTGTPLVETIQTVYGIFDISINYLGLLNFLL